MSDNLSDTMIELKRLIYRTNDTVVELKRAVIGDLEHGTENSINGRLVRIEHELNQLATKKEIDAVENRNNKQDEKLQQHQQRISRLELIAIVMAIVIIVGIVIYFVR